MIFVYFLLLCGWGYGISRFLLRTKDNRFYIFYPLGLSAVTLITSSLWFFDFHFFQISLAIQAVGWTLLPLLVSDIWLRIKRRKWSQKKILVTFKDQLISKSVTFFDFPWLVLLLLTLFSALILTLWNWSVQPVHWDNITLYDFRAQQIVEGWRRTEFLQNAGTHHELKMYDWHHPWFSSFVLAQGYAFGAENPLPLYWFLAVSLAWHALATWKSWQTRSMFLSGLVLVPSLFIAFTEGYGVLPAALYWGHFFLLTQKVKILAWKDVMYFVLFSGAAMQSRMVEPYWFVFAIWFLFSYKKQLARALVVALAMLTWYFEWSIFVRIAQNSFALLPSDLDPVQGFFRFDPRTFLLSSYVNVMVTFLSATATQFGIIIFAAWCTAQKRLTPWWRSQSLALFASLGILFAGMIMFGLPTTDGWKDIRLALPRASMPLTMLGLILLCDLYQQWRDSSRMK